MKRINLETVYLVFGFFVIGMLAYSPCLAAEEKKGEVVRQETVGTLAGEESLSQSEGLRVISERLDELSERLAGLESQRNETNPGWWTTVLIGFASLSLFVVAVALAAITVGATFWGRPWIEKLVRDEVSDQIELAIREVRARLVGYVGFIFGKLSRQHGELIHNAIKFTSMCYESIPEDSPVRDKVFLNNLVFYCSMRGNPSDRQTALQHADRILELYGETNDCEYYNTYASIMAAFYDGFPNPINKLEEVERTLIELIKDSAVSEDSKENSKRHLRNVSNALDELRESNND